MSHQSQQLQRAKRERDEAQTIALLSGDQRALTLAVEADTTLARTVRAYR